MLDVRERSQGRAKAQVKVNNGLNVLDKSAFLVLTHTPVKTLYYPLLRLFQSIYCMFFSHFTVVCPFLSLFSFKSGCNALFNDVGVVVKVLNMNKGDLTHHILLISILIPVFLNISTLSLFTVRLDPIHAIVVASALGLP